MREKIVPLSAILASAAVLAVLIVMESRPLPAADVPAVGAGNLHVVGGQPPVLFDSASGKSWVLATSPNLRRNAWVPIRRLDSDADIEKWQITGSIRDPIDKEKPEK